MMVEMIRQNEANPVFEQDVLANEACIVWHEDPLAYPYLREMEGLYLEPEHMDPGFGELTLIGYAVAIRPSEGVDETPVYRRRSWWWSKDDPYEKETEFPVEAVIPRFIRAGKASPRGRDCGGDRLVYLEKQPDGNARRILLHPDGSRSEAAV